MKCLYWNNEILCLIYLVLANVKMCEFSTKVFLIIQTLLRTQEDLVRAFLNDNIKKITYLLDNLVKNV